MFWKKHAPSPLDAAPSPGPGETESRQDEARELDAAIDTVVGLLRAFGEHSLAEDTGGTAPSLHPSRPPSQAPQRTASSGSIRSIKIG